MKQGSAPKEAEAAKPLHGILLVLSCIALFLCLVMFLMTALMALTYDTPEAPHEAGWGVIGAGLGNLLVGFAVLMLWEIFRPVWLVGQAFSVILAVRRRGKPRWLWIASLVMTAVFLGLAVGMILMH